MNRVASGTYEAIVRAAAAHGDVTGENEMEIGDLQTALAEALRVLTSEQLENLRVALADQLSWATQEEG